MYGQILLRILPDSFDQLLCVSEQLVAVVIKCRVMQEQAGGAFSLVQPIRNIRESGHGVLQFIRELLVLGERS